MDRFHWKLPAGIRVFHFGAPGPRQYSLTNPILLKRHILSIDPLALLSAVPSKRTSAHDKQRRCEYPVLCQLGRFLLCQREDGWLFFCYADGVHLSLDTQLDISPLTFREAKTFVSRYHRHCAAPQGHKFSIGLKAPDGTLIGVTIASIPKARALNDGYTLEINRVCCDPVYHNAASRLYGSAIRAGRAMGYRRFVTYTLPHESGASVRAVGFRLDGIVSARADGWNCIGRPRTVSGKYPVDQKNRWVLECT